MKLFLAASHAPNPFDLKAALLAGHAQHPVIIHFPIALFIASLAFDFLAIWRRNPALATVAYYNLLAATVMTPVAIASGLTAWQWQLEGARLRGNLLLHLIFALSASGMICVLPQSAQVIVISRTSAGARGVPMR